MILGYRTNSDDFADLVAEHPQLREWLQIATAWLANPGKERIRREIQAHYAEAVAAHLTEGLSESEAKAAAVAELGSAKRAGRRFRRQYLTTYEATILDMEMRWIRGGGMLALNCIFFLVLALSLIGDGHRIYMVLIPAGFLLMIVLPTTQFIMAGRNHRPSPRVVLLSWVPSPCSFVVLMQVRDLMAHGFDWIIVTSLLMMTTILPLICWRRDRKVRRTWPEMPPTNTASF
jgi:hypothetical protein